MDFQNIPVDLLEPYLTIARKAAVCLVVMGVVFGDRLTWTRAQAVSHTCACHHRKVLPSPCLCFLFGFSNEYSKSAKLIEGL